MKLEDEQTLFVDSNEKVLVTQNLLAELETPYKVTLTPPRATDELTARFHCAIRCIAKQLTWANGKLTEEEWKRLIVATVCGQKVLPSLDGKGFVVLDRSTTRMSGHTKRELVEWMYSWGAERGVIFDDPET